MPKLKCRGVALTTSSLVTGYLLQQAAAFFVRAAIIAAVAVHLNCRLFFPLGLLLFFKSKYDVDKGGRVATRQTSRVQQQPYFEQDQLEKHS